MNEFPLPRGLPPDAAEYQLIAPAEGVAERVFEPLPQLVDETAESTVGLAVTLA